MDLTLDTPVRYVPHIGPVMAGRLERLDLFTVQDLLYHVPHRYEDFSHISKINSVQPGDTVTLIATVSSIKTFFTKSGKQIQEAKVSDETGTLSVIWFNQVYLLKILHPELLIHLSGKISWFGTKKVLLNPSYEIDSSLHTGRIVPIYPLVAGVSSKWIRGRIAFILESLLPKFTDFLPEQIVKKYSLMELQKAIASVHFPEKMDDIQKGRRRIAFDEVFLLQLRAYEQKREWLRTHKAKKIKQVLIPTIPFTLTDDQQHAIEDILNDMNKPTPMNRLLVGDVGSGKTVVAATAMYAAFKSGFSSILMAPTQILATQHYETISELLSPYGIKIGLITGNSKSDGDILIGTHALLSKPHKNIGLVVVDEQHRFGVEQRAKLVGTKKIIPHFLTMTATPIPRTIAKTILGSIDISILSTMPIGRLPVKTWVVPPEKRARAYEWIKKQSGQVFIICPLIEDSDTLTEVKAVKSEYERIKKIFHKDTVGLLHGKLTGTMKTKILTQFRNNEFRYLVATPVVEVGIDIPNASIIVIEAAERFGLSQLHQLRGRVGRSNRQSYCLLFSETKEESALTRIKTLETIHSGPTLAEVDLHLRGPGEVFGKRQHGVPNLKIASFTDMETITQTQESLSSITRDDPSLSGFPLLSTLAKKGTIEGTSKD